MGRAERRHQRERIKANVLRVSKNWRQIWTKDDAAVGRLVNHGLQICSCYMCGNPRRYDGGPTMQERKAGEGDE